MTYYCNCMGLECRWWC